MLDEPGSFLPSTAENSLLEIRTRGICTRQDGDGKAIVAETRAELVALVERAARGEQGDRYARIEYN